MSITNKEMEKAHEVLNNVVPFTRPSLAYSSGNGGSWDWLRSIPQGWYFLARPHPDQSRLGISTSRLVEFEVLYQDANHPLALLGYMGGEHWHWTPDFSTEFELKLARKGDDNDITGDSGGHVPTEQMEENKNEFPEY